MELILLEKVAKLGDLGEKVNVKPGFGRNYLVPQGKAVPATAENIARFEARRAELEIAATDRLSGAEARRDAMTDVEIEFVANASEEGKLYGSIGPRDIADSVASLGHALNKSEVVMDEGPIRTVGEFEVTIQLHADVETTIKVQVKPE